ncbi:L-fuculose phosphate aldolase [Bremerella volcania]|uniref:3-oxo-tetronate 4-phosphate decarboxylase n=1 Tax=Bremerella volcania TaxID=2527984 RepID=A0A518C998_9BACT|nr:3-oxo-tetronate 4-phosphate decarboxylase [Bremerella volcania]QDU75792.1 L-fuculose phosphate aldolase [Bremerella volcania]
MSERELREQISEYGKSLFNRGYGVGTSGNISVRLPDGMLITPTNCSLGKIDPERISKVSLNGSLLEGDKPSKEAFLHLAMYGARERDDAVVHLHSTYSVALSCLQDVDPENVIPPLTAYFVMKVGRVFRAPYYPPGDAQLGNAVGKIASQYRAVLLANHGPLFSGSTLDSAVAGIEEMEETAKLVLLLKNEKASSLTPEQCQDLLERSSS